MRYLYTDDGENLIAYAPGRRDFFRSSDDSLWAHESHDWLIAAKSGEMLAHRTGDFYYDVVDGKRLYHITSDREPLADRASESHSGDALRLRRSSRRAMKAQR